MDSNQTTLVAASDQPVPASEAAVTDFDVAEMDAADLADMAVVANGRLTTWVWTFAGPGHAKAIAQSNRLARERLHEDKEKEQARTNGKKWKATEETPDEVRGRNVAFVVERLVGWSPVRIEGEPLAYSEAAATKLLSDPRKVSLLSQALEFLAEDKSFIKRSATI